MVRWQQDLMQDSIILPVSMISSGETKTYLCPDKENHFFVCGSKAKVVILMLVVNQGCWSALQLKPGVGEVFV